MMRKIVCGIVALFLICGIGAAQAAEEFDQKLAEVVDMFVKKFAEEPQKTNKIVFAELDKIDLQKVPIKPGTKDLEGALVLIMLAEVGHLANQDLYASTGDQAYKQYSERYRKMLGILKNKAPLNANEKSKQLVENYLQQIRRAYNQSKFRPKK